MKHAGAEALTSLHSLLQDLRRIDQLKERSPGTFYIKSSAFLHFHEDPAGMFADVRIPIRKTGGGWQRHRVTTQAEQSRLLRLIREELLRQIGV